MRSDDTLLPFFAPLPQGWSKFYEFSGADLRSGADIIELATKVGQGKGAPFSQLIC